MIPKGKPQDTPLGDVCTMADASDCNQTIYILDILVSSGDIDAPSFGKKYNRHMRIAKVYSLCVLDRFFG